MTDVFRWTCCRFHAVQKVCSSEKPAESLCIERMFRVYNSFLLGASLPNDECPVSTTEDFLWLSAIVDRGKD